MAKGPLSSKGSNSKHMKLARAILDSYERQVHTVEGALKEMEENLDDARFVHKGKLHLAFCIQFQQII